MDYYARASECMRPKFGGRGVVGSLVCHSLRPCLLVNCVGCQKIFTCYSFKKLTHCFIVKKALSVTGVTVRNSFRGPLCNGGGGRNARIWHSGSVGFINLEVRNGCGSSFNSRCTHRCTHGPTKRQKAHSG